MVQINDDLNLNNELFSNKFKMVFNEIRAVELLCTSANLPGITGNAIEVHNPHNYIMKGGNKLNFSSLSVEFKVDENLKNYKEIFSWMTKIYAPQNFEQYRQFQEEARLPTKGNSIGYDASLMTLTNADNVNLEIKFVNLFPVSLSGIDFAHQSENVVLATAEFSFDWFYFK